MVTFNALYIFMLFVSIGLVNSTFIVQHFEKEPQPIQNFQDYLSSNDFDGNIWVVLVAGSNGYFNYRHQADVCHAYQVVHSHGVPDENIIVMMYDDIANSKSNPEPGTLINHPDGPDVYKGVPKDYTGKDVTPENFMNVLTGNATGMQGIGSGRVLQSGPNDHVFIYFSDHGAPNLIAFPRGRLYKEDMNSTLMTMYKNKQYKQLVFYLEACNSGSMFDKSLSEAYNMYITTAANAHESSYACYYDKKRHAYLGDRYSVTWMEDSDKENLDQESLHHQYKRVKKLTNQSHVQQFGNKEMSHEIVGFFQGDAKSAPKRTLSPIFDDVPSPDVKIHTLKNHLLHEDSPEIRQQLKSELTKELDMRRLIEKTTSTITDHVSSNINMMTSFVVENQPELNGVEASSCYREAVQAFDEYCFQLDDYEYAYRQIYQLGNMCEMGIPVDTIMMSIKAICNE